MSLKIRLARGGAKKRPFYSDRRRRLAQPARRPLYREARHLQPDAGARPRRPRDPEGRAHPALARGRGAADRPGRAFLGDAGLIEKPAVRETPIKSAPEGARRRSAPRRPKRPPPPPPAAPDRRARLWIARCPMRRRHHGLASAGEATHLDEAGLRRRRHRRAGRARRGADQELHRRARGYRRAMARSRTRAASGASSCG